MRLGNHLCVTTVVPVRPTCLLTLIGAGAVCCCSLAGATYYGRDGWSIHGGSCGYGYLDERAGTGWDVAALSDAVSTWSSVAQQLVHLWLTITMGTWATVHSRYSGCAVCDKNRVFHHNHWQLDTAHNSSSGYWLCCRTAHLSLTDVSPALLWVSLLPCRPGTTRGHAASARR